MIPMVIALTVRRLTTDYCFVEYPPGPGPVLFGWSCVCWFWARFLACFCGGVGRGGVWQEAWSEASETCMEWALPVGWKNDVVFRWRPFRSTPPKKKPLAAVGREAREVENQKSSSHFAGGFHMALGSEAARQNS
jgi:hypothetical protein